MAQSNETLPFTIQVSLVNVYEDQILPPGTTPGQPRAVGHAVGQVRLENLTQTEIPLRIEEVAIHAAADDSLTSSSAIMAQSMSEVTLGGLQIVDRGFHLTNEQGFDSVSQVKAVVTYTVSGNTYTAESDLHQVAVNR
ncbi:MAG: hypothetical protein VKK04_22155 [Synechococcales bacterium]|nr:hypothetical protein [Synechococcales bacterium]